MSDEPIITVNGRELTDEEALAVRLALSMAITCGEVKLARPKDSPLLDRWAALQRLMVPV